LKNYADLVAFIGKSAYDDPYTKIDVDDYAIYDTALDDAAVKDLYTTQVSDKVFKDISVQHCATDDFKIPTTTIGIPVTWTSDNDAISIDSTGTATVTRPAAGEQDATVTLGATVSINGRTITKQFSVNVPHTLSGDEKLKEDADAITIDNADDIRTNFSVPTQGANGSAISWTVSDLGAAQATISDGVNATSQTVSVTRPSAGNEAATVILRAKLTLEGHTSTRDFVVTVQPLPSSSEEDEAYIWAFFTGEGVGGEKISLAASKGNNALDWNTLNDGTPLFTSTQGEQGLRDPFIFKSKDGDKFYMIATDLKISGRAGSFTSAQMNGSKYIEIWESDDLVNWSNERHVKVSSDYAGNTWAPEAYYDSQIGKYVVYWASNLYDGTDATTRTKPSYNRMVYVTTEDFVNFSDPTIWIDVDRRGQDGAGSIDATVQQDGDTYYRVYKDENSMTLRQEQSTNLLATVKGSYPTSSADSGRWSLVKEKIGNGTTGYNGTFAGQGEGPSLFKANAGDVNGYDWYLFIDQPNYHHNQEGNAGPNHYVPFGTNDIANADWTGLAESMPESNFPKNSDGGMPRHGTVLPVTRAQYQKVLEAYAKNIAVSDVQSVSVKTKVGQDPTDLLPSSLTLTKADASQAQANVTWDAIDAQSYAQVGTFTVNGIADDDSAMPVTATVSVTSDEEPSPTEPDVTLKSLTIAGQNVDMKDLMDGSAQLTLEDPSKVGVGDVVAVAHDPEAQVVVDVDGGVVSVTVTSPDGSKNAVYTVKLVKRSAQMPQPGTDQPTTPSNPNTPGAGDGSGKHDLATTGTASAWIVVLSALLALFGIFMLIESRKLHSRV
jgi:hypothetical protein